MGDSNDPPDETLMTGIVAGDREAFAALYRRRRADVFRFAVLMSGSTAVADDVVQDVFMEVIRRGHRYQAGRSGVVPWLLGIARNHVLRSRHQQRRVTSVDDVDNSPALVVFVDPLAGIARREYVAALRRALFRLPVKYREAIVLCDLQGMTYADAAASLGCAIGTVRSRLHRARAMLAARLSQSDAALWRPPLARWMP